MGLFTKPGTIYSERPEILASDHFTSQSCLVTQDMAVEIDGRLIVRKGTIYPENSKEALGIIISDVDVTHGDAPGAYIDHGFVYIERLPVQPTPAAVSALFGAVGFRSYKGPVSSFGAEEEKPLNPDQLWNLSFGSTDQLTPAFDPAIHIYTLTLTGPTSKITVVYPEGATNTKIMHEETEVENGGDITWHPGVNEVIVFFNPADDPSGHPIGYTITADAGGLV